MSTVKCDKPTDNKMCSSNTQNPKLVQSKVSLSGFVRLSALTVRISDYEYMCSSIAGL